MLVYAIVAKGRSYGRPYPVRGQRCHLYRSWGSSQKRSLWGLFHLGMAGWKLAMVVMWDVTTRNPDPHSQPSPPHKVGGPHLLETLPPPAPIYTFLWFPALTDGRQFYSGSPLRHQCMFGIVGSIVFHHSGFSHSQGEKKRYSKSIWYRGLSNIHSLNIKHSGI